MDQVKDLYARKIISTRCCSSCYWWARSGARVPAVDINQDITLGNGDGASRVIATNS